MARGSKRVEAYFEDDVVQIDPKSKESKKVIRKPKTDLDGVKQRKQLSKRADKLSEIKESSTDLIKKKFEVMIPTYIEERKKQFENMLEDFKIANEVTIREKHGKISHTKLSSLLSKPLFFGGISKTEISATDIFTYSQCYWDCVDIANESILYIPTLYQLCGLMGISTSTFVNYKSNSNEDVREAVKMVFDRFVDFYTVKGLTSELNTIMAIFTMKAQYGMRDNDAPQVNITNVNNTVPKQDIADLERQYNFGDTTIIDIDGDI